MTDYVVLRATTETRPKPGPEDAAADVEGEEVVTGWHRLSGMAKEWQTFAASSPERAITLARQELDLTDTTGIYVAVPARSWSPERRWTESKPINRSEPVAA